MRACKKESAPIRQKLVVLKSGSWKKTVKSWQYYSILDFCRMEGMSIAEADRIARWCEKGSNNGDRIGNEKYSIAIAVR